MDSSRVQQVRERLRALPRVPLAHLPTRLDRCENLSRALDGVALSVKRAYVDGLLEIVEASPHRAPTQWIFVTSQASPQAGLMLGCKLADGCAPGETVTFVHTGGLPALFAYADQLAPVGGRAGGEPAG